MRPLRFRNISLLIKSGNKSTFALQPLKRGEGKRVLLHFGNPNRPTSDKAITEMRTCKATLRKSVKGQETTFHFAHILHIIQNEKCVLTERPGEEDNWITAIPHDQWRLATLNRVSMGPAFRRRQSALLLPPPSRAADFNQIVSKIAF